MKSKIQPELSEVLFNSLNEQGFVLQEKCVSVINRKSAATGWLVETTEHPVSLKDKDTRIDVVITESGLADSSKFGVVECKRVNAIRNCWLFGNPLYDVPVHAIAQIVKLDVRRKNSPNVGQVKHDFSLETYIINNWWVQVDLQPRKEKYSEPDPIEKALIQVCHGVGGLVAERIRQISKTIKEGAAEFYDIFDTFFVPIIITTAPLYVCKYELSDVDIKNGRISKAKLGFIGLPGSTKPVKWVLVDYGAPARTIPDEIFKNYYGVDPVDLETYNKRSVFIVRSRYLTEFLKNLHTL